MSKLAWAILKLLLNANAGYLASWHITAQLAEPSGEVEIHYRYPHNDIDQAMQALIDAGLVEEMRDLGQRFRVIVKES